MIRSRSPISSDKSVPMTLSMKLLATAALVLFCTAAADAQPLGEGLHPFTFPLLVTSPETAADDLAPFIEAVRDARIIGLGEPTHGTAEVFQLKHRLIRQLIIQGDVRHIVLEASVGEGTDFDDYISGRSDDLDVLLRNIPLWMFKATDFADLLRWLRSYNATSDQPVRIYGMEAQYADRSARSALAYLRQQDASLADQLLGSFGPERVASDTASASAFAHLYAPISDSTHAAYHELFLRLRSAFDDRRSEFVASTGEKSFEDARRHVAAIGQFTSLALLESTGAQAQLRDYVMAVNVSGVVRRASEGERVIVWGHNEHIWKREGNGGYDVLGRQLARWYGAEYYAVGFDFGSGAYRAPGQHGWIHEVGPPDSDSFTASLARAGSPHAFLDIRGALGTRRGAAALAGTFTVRATAGGQVPMRDGKQMYDQSVTLADRFDGLLYVSTTTPTDISVR